MDFLDGLVAEPDQHFFFKQVVADDVLAEVQPALGVYVTLGVDLVPVCADAEVAGGEAEDVWVGLVDLVQQRAHVAQQGRDLVSAHHGGTQVRRDAAHGAVEGGGVLLQEVVPHAADDFQADFL